MNGCCLRYAEQGHLDWLFCQGGRSSKVWGRNVTKSLTLIMLVSKFELTIKLFAHFPILMM